ncbi:hypothetical protein BU16DRAFT_474474 [Lophium mytilinum]|uniref:Uncharacterized protein n=1 Tax=Lophium mytilinum TaxID=390894 RepID=A0A6A6REW6_9PEZI|nr:hypothetical protein BU16DRAFT_474474 [Lophium mytilinum]
MGPLVRGVSNIIGLGTEAYAHRKRSKSPLPEGSSVQDNGLGDPGNATLPDATSSTNLAPPPYPGGRSRSSSVGSDSQSSYYEEDEDDWARDETQAQLEGQRTHDEAAAPESMDALVDNFFRKHPQPPPYQGPHANRLPCPVIIPQKRPEAKSHGFIRAYAPALAECGIDQATFLDFLDSFTTSIKGSRYFNAANLAVAASVLSYTVAVTPSIIVHVSAAIVHVSIETGRRLHQTSQVNHFLDRMNESLFKPHGLYALLMTYDPKSASEGEIFDMQSNVATAIAKRDDPKRRKMTNFRASSAKTMGEEQLPEAAPLIFPALDAASDEQKLNAFKRAGAFVKDYGDRKAQASFMANQPDSKLNVTPKPEFSSRFADPTHPVHQGGILNLLTGGELKKMRGSRADSRREDRGYDTARDRLHDRRAGRQNKNKVGLGKSSKRGLKRVLAENVLYLMIVDLPSEEELHQAAENQANMKAASGGIFGQFTGQAAK